MILPLMEIYLLIIITKTIMYEAIIQMVCLECVIHLTLNLMIYHKIILVIILLLVLLKAKKTLKFCQVLMLPMKVLKLETKPGKS